MYIQTSFLETGSSGTYISMYIQIVFSIAQNMTNTPWYEDSLGSIKSMLQTRALFNQLLRVR